MKKILLVEDELILGESLVDVLEMKGYEVIWVQSVHEFNKVIDKDKVDLICSDFHLPDGTLVNILERLKQCKKSQNIPVLVISATALEEDKEFIEQHVEYWLYKPFSLSEFTQKLESIAND